MYRLVSGLLILPLVVYFKPIKGGPLDYPNVTKCAEDKHQTNMELEFPSKVPLTEFSKCCPVGESLSEETGRCVNSSLTFDLEIWGKDPPPVEVGLIIGLDCKEGRYRLEPYVDSNDEFKLMTNGSLYVPSHTKQFFSPSEYCLDPVNIPNGEVMVLPYICYSSNSGEQSWKDVATVLYTIGCLTSIPFLLATLIVYSCTPSLRSDVNGKVLCCHVACLSVAYTSLSMVQIFGSELSSTICIVVAFSIQFSFLASFFWLNVLCFHTWRRLRRSSDSVDPRRSRYIKSQKSKRFIYYSIYAWSIPTLFVAITMVMDMNPSVPSSYFKPDFGLDSCWFREDTTALPYFYFPMACILLANLILFIMSAFSVHKNTDKTPTRLTSMRQVVIETINQRRKTIFVECLILFLVMGLNWVFEVISWSVGGPAQLWFVTDLFNTLQGTIVFYVFVVREERALAAFKALLRCKKPSNVVLTVNGNPLQSYAYAPTPTK